MAHAPIERNINHGNQTEKTLKANLRGCAGGAVVDVGPHLGVALEDRAGAQTLGLDRRLVAAGLGRARRFPGT